uniref:Cytosolic endo-beta-N-acetylglucosaminidase TIM barrel domain-containing protein n=1 Tax=Ananas comosus var. bracteatus TaxID=296719 RepID=A0A6V7PDB2_ANACO|nr:unnamed protein product [Ananas comosus var. bracteatus]
MALPRRLPLFPNPRRTLKTLKPSSSIPSSAASSSCSAPPWPPPTPWSPTETTIGGRGIPLRSLGAVASHLLPHRRSPCPRIAVLLRVLPLPLQQGLRPPPSLLRGGGGGGGAAPSAAEDPRVPRHEGWVPRRRVGAGREQRRRLRYLALAPHGRVRLLLHYLVTLPPPCWTNAAHTHGVKVLGTFLAEWDAGKVVCETLLATKSAARMYAERLAELASALGFDGWLINLEVNLDSQLIDNLKEFLHHLTETMHSYVPGSLVIWYDAVTKDGQLDWQDQLNGKNKPFFDLCDGIFVNYTWNEKYPEYSAAVAGERKFDVYMGIDVFGRNTFGGGQWNTNVALDLLKKEDISAAIFAPGWVYETKQEPDFQSAQNRALLDCTTAARNGVSCASANQGPRLVGLVEQSWGILQTYPKLLPFYSNFDQGHGYYVSVEGVQVADYPWTNISCQGFQPALNYFVDPTQTSMQAFVNFKDAPYSGGGALQSKEIFNRALFSQRGFLLQNFLWRIYPSTFHIL